MRGTAVGAAALGALVLAGVAIGIVRSGDPSAPATPSTGQDVSTVTNESKPAGDGEYDPDLEEPVIEPGKPNTLKEFAEDSRDGVAPGEYQIGPKGLESGPLRSTYNP